MTQEQLAEILSISPQAVSRWETEAAMPDISLIAPLCNLFNITSDELLEIDIQNKEAKISEFTDEYAKFASSLRKTEELRRQTIRKLREGLRLYPNTVILKKQLATVLWLNAEAPEDKDEKSEMCRLCRELIEVTADIKEKCRYIFMYCSYARFTGNSEEGKKLAQLLPETENCRQRCLAICCEDNAERNEQLYEYMRSSWGALRDALLLLIVDGNNSSEEIINIRKKQEKIYEILFDNDDIVKYEDFDEYKIAKAFYKVGDFDKSIDYLEMCLHKWTEIHPIEYVSSWRGKGREPSFDYDESEKIIRIEAEGFINLVKSNFSSILNDKRMVNLISKAEQVAFSQ